MKISQHHYPLIFTIALVFISRLPFINLGYGSEEDAWGLRLTAENISQTGVYEVSRLPGHPLQEYIYSLLWPYGHLAFNLLTVLISTTGVLFFILVLRKLNAQKALAAGIALAFTPIIYINSFNAMDYTWAVSFIIAAFYFLLKGQLAFAGILLGLAAGCRITSGAMLLPFTIYLFNQKNFAASAKKMVMLSFFTLLVSVICFIPVYNIYGNGFFTHYEHFPLPAFAKNVFKGTIGVWGTIGFVVTLWLFVGSCIKFWKGKPEQPDKIESVKVFMLCTLVGILYLIAFCVKPLKSAFLIPLIPFVVLLISKWSSPKAMMMYSVLMILSCFSSGINLADANRGSDASPLAITCAVAGQEINFDVVNGPVVADYTKQKRLIRYSKEVIERAQQINTKKVIIAGWYLNFILGNLPDRFNENILFTYYVEEETLKAYISSGYSIYYLPLQNEYNDLRFNKIFTARYARPF